MLRERIKAEKERERAAKLQAKLDEQKRVEAEIADIEEDNYVWTNIHTSISPIVTNDDINEVIGKCDYEQQNDIADGFFQTKCPEQTQADAIARKEAETKFDIDKAQKDLSEAEILLDSHKLEESEPTTETIREELADEAKDEIRAFLPWKQAKLRKSYIADHFEERFKKRLDDWTKKEHDYQTRKQELSNVVKDKKKVLDNAIKSKEEFLKSRAKELYQSEVAAWKEERDDFYNTLRQSMQNVIDGDRDYIIAAISSLFPDEELPMEYFVDFAYQEEGNKILVDLDLPEIEDLPDKKIVLTPTGKKSIRLKGLTDLRSDYANCVLGLAIQVAQSIFNVSLKINDVEICGYTQRKEANSAVPTDQYIFVVNFDRKTFSKIDFDKLTALQIMDFFKHHYVMLKSYEMKQIDLSNAYDKMEAFVVANYEDFVDSLPEKREEYQPVSENQQQAQQEDNSVPSDNSQAPIPQSTIDLIHNLLNEGGYLQAIKEYKDATGVGLVEAKAYIDSLKSRIPRPADSFLGKVQKLVSEGKPIQAIKLYKDTTGCSLVEAKAFVDKLM